MLCSYRLLYGNLCSATLAAGIYGENLRWIGHGSAARQILRRRLLDASLSYLRRTKL